MITSNDANKNYRIFFISMVVSTFGSFMFFAAIQIKIFTENSAYYLFLSILAYTIPSIFIIPFIIKYTYKASKRNILIFCSLLRLIFSVYLFFNHSINEIFICIFILSLISGVSFIAQKTILYALVNDYGTLVVKNSWLSSSEVFAEILGAVVGSIFILLMGFEGVVIILTGCLTLSTLLIFRISGTVSDAYEIPLMEAYKDVIKIIRHDRPLLVQIVFFCNFMAFGTLLYGFLIAFVSHNFQITPYTYSFFLLAAGIGAVLGAKLVSYITDGNIDKKLKVLFEYSFLVGAVLYILFSHIYILFLNILIYFLYSLTISILKNVHQGFVYSKFPTNLQEPAWGILNIFWHLTILISSLFSGMLIDLYGINWVLNKGSYLAAASIILFSLEKIYNRKYLNSKETFL